MEIIGNRRGGDAVHRSSHNQNILIQKFIWIQTL
jgi:hypothetical protein